jgi:hypothetical protein
MKIGHSVITNGLLFLILVTVVLIYLKIVEPKLIDNFEDEPARNLVAQRKLLRSKIDEEQKL